MFTGILVVLVIVVVFIVSMLATKVFLAFFLSGWSGS